VCKHMIFMTHDLVCDTHDSWLSSWPLNVFVRVCIHMIFMTHDLVCDTHDSWLSSWPLNVFVRVCIHMIFMTHDLVVTSMYVCVRVCEENGYGERLRERDDHRRYCHLHTRDSLLVREHIDMSLFRKCTCICICGM